MTRKTVLMITDVVESYFFHLWHHFSEAVSSSSQDDQDDFKSLSCGDGQAVECKADVPEWFIQAITVNPPLVCGPC